MSERPSFRVVRGNPDDAELAALTVVLAAVSPGSTRRGPDKAGRRSWWANRAALVRRPIHPGERAWRASSLPG